VDRKCLDCGDVLKGRADKKFCSDQCRNNYNNNLNKDNNSFVRNVHALLRRNRKILADLYEDNRSSIHKDALFALGYNFNYFTHTVETSAGDTLKYCFEYGFQEVENDFIELKCNTDLLGYI